MFGTAPFKAPWSDPYKCPFCMRWLSYKGSEPIKTDFDRMLAKRGLTMNPGILSQPPSTKRQCDTCHDFVELDTMIWLRGSSRYCSQKCADIEAEKIAASAARVLALKKEMPWLK
jgi:hypothetical protein